MGNQNTNMAEHRGKSKAFGWRDFGLATKGKPV